MKISHGKGLMAALALVSAMLGLSFMAPPEAISAQTGFTIWPGTMAPVIADSGPDRPVELGLKFRSDSSGTITGARFYKGAGNTGIHVANLWTGTGTLLATATFTNETASGWQQVSFPAPVAIAANTVFVVSYHTGTGHYSCDQNYFAAGGADSPPLHALADGVSGVNGVYAYGPTSSFPTLGWRSSNYWVDVLFSTTETPDTTSPVVTSFTVPSASTSLIVPISSLTATDNVAVTGYLVNESASVPSLSDPGWSSSLPGSYAFATEGSMRLYAWARDAAGNVSASLTAAVTVSFGSAGPEPAGWYAGDMHVHRSCGGTPEPVADVCQKMAPQNLSVISLLADMGNGEVKDPVQDLPRVNGQNDPVSTPDRVVHWDAEFHWDPVYMQYPHQVLGGHVVTLGLSEAHQIWEDYTYPIFEWAHRQNGIAGFAHMQYLDNGIPQTLNCCIPIEYPVEVALGASDFISEDINGSDTAINAYYRLLNSGFRPGFAAGTDYPCNSGADPGTLLTYVQVEGGQMTYRNWIEGIARGRTVVSRNGHNEFLDLKVNGSFAPGDEIGLTAAGSVQATVRWTTAVPLTGTVELVHNGVVVAARTASAAPGTAVVLDATVEFTRSGWLAARRMDANGHQTHSGAVFVLVNNAPVRASVADAEFYVQWMDNLLARTAPGGAWSSYFVNNRDAARARYQAAKAIFQQIALEAASSPPQASFTIWPGTTVPATVDSGPDSAVELGIKFRADVSGFITGIRFYKASTNTGTHVGNLWSSSGTKLATATFTNESGSGWQQASFPTPVAIAANIVYIASYHTSSGHYSNDQYFFASSGVDSLLLHVPADGVNGYNGVFSYGSVSSFPDQGWRSSNYWIDVVFLSSLPPDTTAPTVTAFTIPVTSASLTVAISSLTATDDVSVTGFLISEEQSAPSPTAAGWSPAAPSAYTFAGTGTRTLYAWARDAAGNVSVSRSASVVITQSDTSAPTVTSFTIPGTSASLSVAISSLTATDNVGVTGYLVSEEQNAPSPTAAGWSATVPTFYTSTSEGAKTLYAWAKDAAGNVSASRNDSVVITLPPGGQILIITSAANPFTGYYGEILRTEGFTAFEMKDIESVTPAVLASYDLAILGEMTLTPPQVTILEGWVNTGGRLIAMHPDDKLDGLLGLNHLGSSMPDAYMLVNATSGPGVGIVNQTMQYHGEADLCRLSGASSLATLYRTSSTATSYPAVTLRSVGSMGGRAAAFTYDLARSVVYTRQGNPAWGGQERDGYPPIRPDDLFYGNSGSDPGQDWVDPGKIAIPQADEQQRLLANLIIRMDLDRKLLPRFWYFPRRVPAVVVMSGDDHDGGGTVGRFDDYNSFSPPGCSVQDWECVRSTSYIYPDNPYLSPAQAESYTSEGFEVALHLNTECEDWTPATLSTYFLTQLKSFRQKYPTLPPPVTNRTHCIVWSDYASKPLVEQANGISLDTTYYFWPPEWVANIPGLFTGSGMPMKFADAAGNLIHVYQVPTQMTDESGQAYPFTIDTLLDRAIGPEGYYGAFAVNMHTDSAYSSESDAIVTSARNRGIPVISARQLLEWLNARNAATFTAIDWNGVVLSFSVSSASGARGLVAMVPVPTGKTVTRVNFEGNPVSFQVSAIKGIKYALFEASDGSYQVTYVPVVGSVSPDDGATGIGTGTAVTATFPEPMDSSTVTSGTFLLLDQSGTPVPAAVTYDAPALTATLSPAVALANSTTYTGKVKGGAGGVMTAAGTALPGDYTWSFTTIPEGVKPVVTEFEIPAASASLNVPISRFSATDNAWVSGYLVTESSVAPLSTDGGWSAGPPASYTFRSSGDKTLYAWARDASGNVSTGRSAGVVITAAGPYSIWTSSAKPVVADGGADSAVELGVRFRADVSGYITGIRFYKSGDNTGTHVANLWTSTGTHLATATFTDETSSGWQQVYFATPVAVTANTVYVASYHANTGHYSCDQNYFASTGVDRAPLHAPVNTASSPNGVYSYGSASQFPDLGWKSSNYWVDVIMQP